MQGKLYLIPTFLADTAFNNVMPELVKQKLEQINNFFVEDEKTARRYIKKVVKTKIIDEIEFFIIGKHANLNFVSTFLKKCQQGLDVGLLSEAGVPAVADPGSVIVEVAHKIGVQVVPLVGPSSILMALMASGFSGQSFAFNGYLPIDKVERKQRLRFLEGIVEKQGQSQIFIETPFRNESLLEDILKTLKATTKLCIASNISSENEFIASKKVIEWQKVKKVELHKIPTVFIIGK